LIYALVLFIEAVAINIVVARNGLLCAEYC